MTDERQPGPDKHYKQLVVISKSLNKKMYTSCRMSEEDYMALSPLWQMLKDKVKARDGYKCVKCCSVYNLCVHHTRYPEAWGEENPDDLITLCDKCHNELHGKKEFNQ